MTSLLEQWINHAVDLSHRKANFYSGARKILRPVRLKFTSMDDSLQLSDAGYTSNKMRMLEKNYVHEESLDTAIQLWDRRLGQAKYGSVGFTCYNHFVKGGSIDAKRSKRASVFGPCIQSVTLTWLDRKTVGVDIFYRTTEFYKKFAPDLVLIRDVLLADFTLPENLILHFHFANVTCHAMYLGTIFPYIDDPVSFLEEVRETDEYFWIWSMKWTSRYLCPEHARGIAKFSQALRVAADLDTRIQPKKKEKLVKYLRDNHPGFKRTYVDPNEDEDGED
jgi:hypothetical protein